MMVRPALRRTVSLGAIGLLLIGALAYVMRNTGPLAPVQVQREVLVPVPLSLLYWCKT